MASKVSVASDNPMTEPPQTRGLARDLLLAAASDIMRERDSLELSLSDIANRAGVNSALVKYYFGNKHGLLLALLERDLAIAIEQLQGLVRMSISPTRKMRAHLSGVVKIYFQFPYLNRLSVELLRDADIKVAQRIADRFLRPIYDAYTQMINEGVAAGEFQYVDPKLFYFMVIGACDQIFTARFVLKYVHGEEMVIDDKLRRTYADHVTLLIMEGLKAPVLP
ncbi:TetR family transcriptional regulator [Niveispirillum sp. BGYR6]|uniref:TetR family transcriptional regulator n=1 Tax=Niveispirillum sp. BGYR6 TaxID=2971249 RepID=UPI0022B95B97|nr:TetR family transcriptional regulator [Niveispirillum sp. BGYR6]MDG5498026.1 TetR family transcriptional regulator [Niveispirillum sp. BGYR6]